MVFLSLPSWTRITFVQKTRGPDRFWKRRKVLRMSAHFYGRPKGCYTMAVQHVKRALQKSTYARSIKYKDRKELQNARLSAACEEHGFNFQIFRESLIRSDVLLNRKVLCDLAIWEPRTFKCLTNFAWNVAKMEGLNDLNTLDDPPKGVVIKSMYRKK